MTDQHYQQTGQLLSEEHSDLRKQISDLGRFWSEVSQLGRGPRYEEMGRLVRQFRERLSQHFENEEHDSLIAGAANSATKFSENANQLMSEHAELLSSLDDFVRRLEQCSSAFHSWEQVRTEFRSIIQRLDDHESAEMSLFPEIAISMQGTL